MNATYETLLFMAMLFVGSLLVFGIAYFRYRSAFALRMLAFLMPAVGTLAVMSFVMSFVAGGSRGRGFSVAP